MTDKQFRRLTYLLLLISFQLLVISWMVHEHGPSKPPECGTVVGIMDASGRMTELQLYGVAMTVPNLPYPSKGVLLAPGDGGQVAK